MYVTRWSWSYAVRTASVGAISATSGPSGGFCMWAPGVGIDVGHNNKPRFFVSLPLIVGYHFSEDASERMRKCRTLFGWLSPVL
jgi:hypothetical protein